MKTVGAFEAKTRLSELIREVEEGETFEITKNNRKVAMLVPALIEDERQKAIRSIQNIRKGILRGKLSIRQMREQGRK